MRLPLLLVLLATTRAADISNILGDLSHFDIGQLGALIEEVLKYLNLPDIIPHVNLTDVHLSLNCYEELKLFTTEAGNLVLNVPGLVSPRSGNMTTVGKEYVLPMLDASAKIGPGIMRGHLRQTGLFTECKAINYKSTELKRRLHGEYFRIFIDSHVRSYNREGACTSPMISTDFCLPGSCTSKEILSLLRSVQPLKKASPVCQVYTMNERVPKAVTGTYIVGAIFIAIVITCVMCSIADYLMTPNQEFLKSHGGAHFWWKILQAFSLHRNILEIFRVDQKSHEGQIETLNCMRFFSMCWVISGHMMVFFLLVVINPVDLLEFARSWTGQIYANAFFSVDTYFFISGLLLAFVWFKALKKKPKVMLSGQGWFKYYLHRFVRITPAYYMAVLFYTFVYTTFLTDMPALVQPEFEKDSCRQNWWINLLYLNNYIDQKNMCYIVSWYLATDIQIYLFTPIVLIPFAYYGATVGYSVCFFLISLSTGLSVFQVYKMGLPPSSFKYGGAKMGDPDQFQFWEYYQPYIRCQVYIMGMVVGYFLQSKKTLRIPKIVNMIMFILSFVFMMLVVFGLHGWINGTNMSLFTSAMYNSFSKPAWTIAISWIVIASYYGQGGPIGAFMSWWIWVPLGRLSYCAYLVHIPVVIYSWGLDMSERVFTGFPDLLVSFVFPGILYTYFVSVFWSACFELPFAKLESILFGGRRDNYVAPVKVDVNVLPVKLPEKYTALPEVAVTEKSQNWT